MDIKKLEEELLSFLKEEGYQLFSLRYKNKDKILEVVLDESLDLNEISALSDKISNFLDTLEIDVDNYLLDVTTVGIERPIRNLDEAKKAIGSYVFVKTKKLAINGTLEKVENDIISMSYKEKNIKKKIDIEFKDVKEMRYAVEL